MKLERASWGRARRARPSFSIPIVLEDARLPSDTDIAPGRPCLRHGFFFADSVLPSYPPGSETCERSIGGTVLVHGLWQILGCGIARPFVAPIITNETRQTPRVSQRHPGLLVAMEWHGTAWEEVQYIPP
ncbi:hypothetical protein BC826DRAFT_459052 [Russula brevipes]|nr:hypothetical protein BC826DRAFT_459052 [Russula brevipes]